MTRWAECLWFAGGTGVCSGMADCDDVSGVPCRLWKLAFVLRRSSIRMPRIFLLLGDLS